MNTVALKVLVLLFRVQSVRAHRVFVCLLRRGLIYSVALVRERTIPTERPPPVGEVSANFCG